MNDHRESLWFKALGEFFAFIVIIGFIVSYFVEF